ncbi:MULTISPECIES: GNAT family N-acetyltransferase [Paenibacillus]|uniref:GNAT family N-acetyltransferase n=1 Tax=Paenibacillus TaxID=44249 RepID=UPI0030D5F835
MLPFQVNESIVLKLIQSRDRDELYALIDENRKYLRAWLLWVDKRQSPSDLDSVIEVCTHNYEEKNGFDSGIWFNEQLLKYLFNELKLNRVIIQCAENNFKSRAIPEKIGFSNEGTSREAQWVYDHYENIVTYSLLSSEWHT